MITSEHDKTSEATYRIFGLTVSSVVPLAAPCFDAAVPEVAPDVTIRFGDVPEIGAGEPDLDAGVLCRASDSGFLFGFDDTVRFSVRDGWEIMVDQRSGADPDFVRLMLQGSPFGALLHQRGLLVQHGCTAVIGGRAIAVVGRSSVGKSTLSVALLRRGHSVLGDDIAAMRVDEAQPVAMPSFREAKLWGDMADHFGSGDLRPLWAGTRKFSVPLPETEEREAPLVGVVELELGDGPQIEVEPITGAQRIATLLTHTYRRNFLKAVDRVHQNYGMCARIAQDVPMWRIKRPRRPAMLLDELVELIEKIAFK